MEDVQRGKQALLIYSGPFSHSFLTKDFDIHIIYLPLSLYLSLYLSSHCLSIHLSSSYHFSFVQLPKVYLFLCKDWSLTLHLILHIFAPYTQSTNVLRKKKIHTHTTHRRILFVHVPQFTTLCSCCFLFFEYQLPQQLTFSF